MVGEEKEIKRTLSCQDFVTLHILVQVMFFWSSLLALERFLLFHLEKNLFFHLDSLKTTKKVYSCDISHDFDNCTEETRKHGYMLVVYASAPW